MPPSLPEEIQRHLDLFVAAAQTAFGDDLAAAVLFGSAADGQLRATSDVNLLLLLKRFTPPAADALRGPLRMAHAAIDLQVMFLLESELTQAADAFAVKFADIIARHRVLLGNDPFASLHTSRDAVLRRLRQVLLNQQVRMRERYMLFSLNEEQLAGAIADAAGPLRSAAASLAQLDGKPALVRQAGARSVCRPAGRTGPARCPASHVDGARNGAPGAGAGPARLYWPDDHYRTLARTRGARCGERRQSV